jgi:hypothetical protein
MSLEAIKQCEQDATNDDFKTMWRQKHAQLSRAYVAGSTFDPVRHWIADIREQGMHVFNQDYQAKQEQTHDR